MSRPPFLLHPNLVFTLVLLGALAGCDEAAVYEPASVATTIETLASPVRAGICHFDSELGSYTLLDLVDRAAEAHRRHGDAGPGEAVPGISGFVFDEDCQLVAVPYAELEQLAPIHAVYESGAYLGSTAGEVTGSVKAVDINLLGDRANTSACEAADFAGIDFSGPSDIALVQRGTCQFADKVANAEAAGAEAVIIFNQGNSPDRLGLIVGNATVLTGGGIYTPGIPIVGASFDNGVALADPGSVARVRVDLP